VWVWVTGGHFISLHTSPLQAVIRSLNFSGSTDNFGAKNIDFPSNNVFPFFAVIGTEKKMEEKKNGGKKWRKKKTCLLETQPKNDVIYIIQTAPVAERQTIPR